MSAAAATAEAAAAPPPEEAEALRRTLPGRLVDLARRRSDEVALREKRLGIWREITWADYLAEASAAALMLEHLGVGPGDHVAVLSDNRPEWLYVDLAAQGIGARTVGLYQTSPPNDLAYILAHCESVVLFCEDQEQVDKAVEVAAKTPSLRYVVPFDMRGLRHYGDPRLLPWRDFIAKGRKLLRARPQAFRDRVAALDPSEPAMVVYTSGTTGRPKGALLTHENVCVPADAGVEVLGVRGPEIILSYLPLCHVAEKIFSLFIPLTSGSVVHFGESIDTVQEDLREVQPTVFLGVPRIWEKIGAKVDLKMRDASWLKRTLFRVFEGAGRRIAARRRSGRIGLLDRIVWLLGHIFVYRPLKERLGLSRCRLPVTGAAAISPDLVSWFHGLGVPIHEGYGQTECAGVSHTNRPGGVRIGTVGRPLPVIECRTADDGEILVRGPPVFAGYLHDEEETKKTVDSDGWLHTGDVGDIDDEGYLTITGRKKEIFVTSGGKNLSPERIENTLKESPFIKEAVAIGDGRNYVAALIQIEIDTVGDWATRRQIAYTSYEDLAGNPAVEALVRGEVERANERMARVENVRTFRILPKALSEDDGELTATQKVRRRNVHDAYANLIASMYGGRG